MHNYQMVKNISSVEKRYSKDWNHRTAMQIIAIASRYTIRPPADTTVQCNATMNIKQAAASHDRDLSKLGNRAWVV